MFWFSIDAPHSGKWALELKRDCKLYLDVFLNIMVDANTDLYGCSDWLVYSSQYLAPKDKLWLANRPCMFNNSYPSVEFAQGISLKVPKHSIFSVLSVSEYEVRDWTQLED